VAYREGTLETREARLKGMGCGLRRGRRRNGWPGTPLMTITTTGHEFGIKGLV